MTTIRSSRSLFPSALLVPLAASALALAPVSARAQATSNPALAESLFREGEALVHAGKLHEGCEKFAESQRLDPALGTLINLAICHEKEGKTASAWAEYVDAAEQAARSGQHDRAKGARTRAAALEARVPHLTLVFADRSTISTLTLDGTPVGAPAWSTPIPLDPGTHTLTFAGDGKRTVTKKVDVAQAATVNVDVPALEPAPAPAAPAAGAAASQPAPSTPASAPPASPDADRGARATSSGSARRTIGFVAGGVGLVALGVGTFFGIRALGQASDGTCNGNVCADQAAIDAREDARSSARIADVGLIVGAIALAGGVVLVLTAPKGSPSSSLHLGASAAPGGGGLSIGGAL